MTMKKEESLLLKDQISSYFGRMHAKKDGLAGFSIGSISTATAERGSSHRPASAVMNKKTALFYSQLRPTNSDSNPSPPMTVEEEKASSAARCLAILGATSAAASQPLPTQEEISISRQRREEELMKKYHDIKRIEEENKNRRPLVWDKPTFCPFGGETKSDDDKAKSKELPEGDKSKSNKKRARDDDASSELPENSLRKISSSSSIDSCSNLLRKPSSSSRNAHTNLFPYLMMSGPASATNGIEWSKEEVDSFVEFTDKWLPSKKKRRVDEEDKR